MSPSADNRLIKLGLAWLVIAVSVALLTPWGIAHRQWLPPKLTLVVIVFGTLSGATFLVQGVVELFAGRGGWNAGVLPFCYGIGCLLLALTFLASAGHPAAQNYTLAGATLFMIVAAVLQRRARSTSP